MIYKKSDPILRERCRKTQKSMKWVIVSNGACGQHNDVFYFLGTVIHIGIASVVDLVID